MHALIALVRKDLVLYFSNRRALLVTLAAPIAIAAFFGSLFGGSDNQAPSRVPIVIIDHDQSAISKRIVAAMTADKTFDVQALDEAQAAEAVKRGKLRAVVTLPRDFGEQAPRALFGASEKPVIEIRYDPSQAIVLQVVQGFFAQHAMESVTRTAFSFDNDAASIKMLADARHSVSDSASMSDASKRNMLALFDSVDRVRSTNGERNAGAPASNASSSASFQVPYTVKQIEASSRPESKYNGFSHSFAGMGVQFILFMGIDLGIKLLTTRRMGLWQRLRAAPLSRGYLLASQIASGALIAAILFALIFAAGMLFFGVRIEGSVAGFIGLIIAFALMTAGFGLFIAALGKTPEATRGLAIFATLVMVMLGGAWVPSFVFPQWLQTASLVMPTRWAVDGFDAMTWRGLGWDAAWPAILVLLGFAVLFGLIATLRFEWDEKSG
ncbi:MAG: ABC transporter permease [Burkholderiaceae bacterium]